MAPNPIIQATNLQKTYMLGKIPVQALQDANLQISKKENFSQS